MATTLVPDQYNLTSPQHLSKLTAEVVRQLYDSKVRLIRTEDADDSDLDWHDGLAIGPPTNFGCVTWQMKQCWTQQEIDKWDKRERRICCVFSAAGVWSGGHERTRIWTMSLMMNYGFLVLVLRYNSGSKFSGPFEAISSGGPQVEYFQHACRRLGKWLSDGIASMLYGRTEKNPLNQIYGWF